MLLVDACTELQYAKDWTQQTTLWYTKRLALFRTWCEEQNVTTLEAVTAPLARRYIDYLQNRQAKDGGKLDTHTVHGHVRIIRTLLFWAVSEGLIDEAIPKRIKPPKRRG